MPHYKDATMASSFSVKSRVQPQQQSLLLRCPAGVNTVLQTDQAAHGSIGQTMPLCRQEDTGVPSTAGGQGQYALPLQLLQSGIDGGAAHTRGLPQGGLKIARRIDGQRIQDTELAVRQPHFQRRCMIQTADTAVDLVELLNGGHILAPLRIAVLFPLAHKARRRQEQRQCLGGHHGGPYAVDIP